MVQDISPMVFDNEFHPRSPKIGDVIMIYGRLSVYVKSDDGENITLPTYPSFLVNEEDFLFYIDGKAYYDYKGPFDEKEFVNLPFNINTYSRKPCDFAFAALTGYHIHIWKGNHKYCGRCGSKLILSKTERALTCPDCHHTIYPDIHPAVNIAITCKNRLLMVKNKRNPNGPFVLVAGFIEVGESAEETVKREAKEEVGLNVTNIRYIGSQPWGSAGNLQLGFVCEVKDDDKVTLEEDELAESRWFDRKEVPLTLGHHSITGVLIEKFSRGEI